MCNACLQIISTNNLFLTILILMPLYICISEHKGPLESWVVGSNPTHRCLVYFYSVCVFLRVSGDLVTV
jgi:hypothetical protein